MYNIKEVKEATKIQNNLSTFIIMSLTLIIGILYMNRLFCLLKSRRVTVYECNIFYKVI